MIKQVHSVFSQVADWWISAKPTSIPTPARPSLAACLVKKSTAAMAGSCGVPDVPRWCCSTAWNCRPCTQQSAAPQMPCSDNQSKAPNKGKSERIKVDNAADGKMSKISWRTSWKNIRYSSLGCNAPKMAKAVAVPSIQPDSISTSCCKAGRSDGFKVLLSTASHMAPCTSFQASQEPKWSTSLAQQKVMRTATPFHIPNLVKENYLSRDGSSGASTVAELKLPWEDWKRILLQLLRNLRICCDVEFSMALQSENIRYHMLSHPRSFRFLEGLALFSSAMSLWTLCRTILGYIYPLSLMAWKINDCHGISHCYVWSLGFSIHPGCAAGILAIFSTHGGTSHTNGGRGENGWQQHVPRTEQCW